MQCPAFEKRCTNNTTAGQKSPWLITSFQAFTIMIQGMDKTFFRAVFLDSLRAREYSVPIAEAYLQKKNYFFPLSPSSAWFDSNGNFFET